MMNGYGEETGKNTAVRSKKFTNRSLDKCLPQFHCHKIDNDELCQWGLSLEKELAEAEFEIDNLKKEIMSLEIQIENLVEEMRNG